MCGPVGVAAERKKIITSFLPTYQLCTAAGAGAAKFKGRVRTQEAHERPTEHHYYMYAYHTAAAVVVPFTRQQRQYDTRTCNGGTTDWCYFLLLLAAVIVRSFAPDEDSCVLALSSGLPSVLLQ